MHRYLRVTLPWLLAIVCAPNLAAEEQERPPGLATLLGADAETGFARALEPRSFEFPRDHGPHPEFRNEW